MHPTLLNSKISKNFRNQGETLFCWAFAISTMLRQSLNSFIRQLNETSFNIDAALKKLNEDSVDIYKKHLTDCDYIQSLGYTIRKTRSKKLKSIYQDVRKTYAESFLGIDLDKDIIGKHIIETEGSEEESVDMGFHRQLRNELIMVPIPKNVSTEYNSAEYTNSALNQGHYLNMAFERVIQF